MKIYRGENICNGKKERVQCLKTFLRHGLPSDFINGGNPYRVQQLGLFNTTVLHVAKNNLGVGPNGFKHFLSFSQSKATAEGYAMAYWDAEGNKLANNYELFDEHYTPDLDSYRDEDIWHYTQHLLIELDITGAQPAHPTAPFLKTLTFNGGAHRLLALDVAAYLTLQIRRIGEPSSELLQQFPTVLPQLNAALDFASTDTEWLIGSLDPIPPQPGLDQSFSALIPHSPILEINHHVEGDYFARGGGGWGDM